MKKSVKLSIFLVIILTSLSFVSAACVSPNQTIITLYKSNNSHMALFNNTVGATNPPVSICFNEIFGFLNDNDNPWASNPILKLSGFSNAHGESESGNNYPILVNYSSLTCSIKSNCNPSNYEKPVMALSGTTNAHGAVWPFANYMPLCCRPEFQITQVKWTTISGIEIADTQEICVGNSVKIYVKGSGIANKANVTIQKAGVIAFGGVFSWNQVGDIREVELSKGEGSINFYLNESDLGGSDSKKFRFIVNVMDQKETANELIVIGSPCSDNPVLNIDITGLKDRMAYFTGVNNSISYVLADDNQKEGLELSWSIPEENSFTSNAAKFNYSFSSGGQKTIILNAKNKYGAKAHLEISVLAIGTSQVKVMNYIDEPTRRNLITTANKESITIPFDGSGSYVLKTDGNLCNPVSCLAGNCPDKMENIALGCSSLSNIQGSKLYGDMNYAWSRNEDPEELLGGMGAKSNVMIYTNTMYSQDINDKKIDLNLNYFGNESASYREFTVGQCIMDNNIYIKGIDHGIALGVNTLRDPEAKYKLGGNIDFDPSACKGADGTSGNRDDCCPNGYYCSENDGCLLRVDERRIQACADLKNEVECDNWPIMNILGEVTQSACGVTSNVCGWDGAKCNSLIVVYNKTTAVENARKTISYENLTSCDPSSGYWTLNKTVTCTGTCKLDAECDKSESIVLKCGVPMFEVPFFGIYEMMLGLLGIGLVYFLYKRR